MAKYLWIPLVGTAAAIIAILIFRQEREAPASGDLGGLPPAPTEAFPEPDVPEELLAPPRTDPEPAPPPKPREWSFFLNADGSLSGAGSDEKYGSVQAVLERLATDAAARPRILLGQGEGVSEQQLEEAAAAFRASCDVRIIRRGQDEKPPERETDQK